MQAGFERTPAILALEDGSIWAGSAFGAIGQRTGEVVFNTAMTGYQEVLSDPSYFGQIVVMTAPHIGNTGVNDADGESRKWWLSGFVVRAASPRVSNRLAQGFRRRCRKPSITICPASVPVTVEFRPLASRATPKRPAASALPSIGVSSS